MYDGVSRYTHSLREIALQGMIEVIAQQRIERALNSKTRIAVQLEEVIHVGDVVEFHRAGANEE
eukprot:4327665-Prorocentrum_lima.AAC.1